MGGGGGTGIPVASLPAGSVSALLRGGVVAIKGPTAAPFYIHNTSILHYYIFLYKSINQFYIIYIIIYICDNIFCFTNFFYKFIYSQIAEEACR